MPTPTDAALLPLDAVERGFVLGVLLLGTAEDGDLTAPLLSPSRERCAAALAAISALPRADRVRVTGAMAREAMTAFPAGIETVNPEQLAAALAGESPATLALIARGAPRAVQAAMAMATGTRDGQGEGPAASSELDATLVAELQRAALAPIAALPPRSDVTPERRALALLEGPLPALLAETTRLGAPALGRQLADAERDGLGAAELLLAIAQRLSPALGRALLDAAVTRQRERTMPPSRPVPSSLRHHRR